MKPASAGPRRFRLHRGRKHRPKPPPCPLTRADVQTLATYNAERARGIEHAGLWRLRMAGLQIRYDAWLKAASTP